MPPRREVLSESDRPLRKPATLLPLAATREHMGDFAPTTEELLAHTEWLTRLARALVGDATAGDVVQDTYEVALGTAAHRRGPLRPWLGGVARNVARMATRSRVRRERREQALPEHDDVPSPEQ
ncbi:MAG: sigma factor, partial [Kofleriaceae bacterium]